MIRAWFLRWQVAYLRDRADMLDAYACGHLQGAEDCRREACRLEREIAISTRRTA
jgi:hypothetical protein